MSGRWFSGRKVEAFFYTGEQRYKKSGAGAIANDGDEAAEKERLEDFENWLMAEGETQ